MKNFKEEILHRIMQDVVRGIIKGLVNETGYNMNIHMFGVNVSINQSIQSCDIDLSKYEIHNARLKMNISVNSSIFEILKDKIIDIMTTNAIFSRELSFMPLLLNMLSEKIVFDLEDYYISNAEYRISDLVLGIRGLNLKRLRINSDTRSFEIEATCENFKLADESGIIKDYIKNSYKNKITNDLKNKNKNKNEFNSNNHFSPKKYKKAVQIKPKISESFPKYTEKDFDDDELY